MKAVRNLLVSALFLGAVSQVHAADPVPNLHELRIQSPRAIAQQAKQQFQDRAYKQAYFSYLVLSESQKLSIEEAYQFGKSALEMLDFATAKQQLQRALRRNERYPLVEFEYAKALKMSGEYETAIQFFQAYAQRHQNDIANEYTLLAQRHVEGCRAAIRSRHTQEFMLEDMAFSAKGTTRAMTVASRHGFRLVEFQDAKGTCLKLVDANMNVLPIESSVGNPVFQTSAACIAPDGETIYFTRPEKAVSGMFEQKIYSAKLTADGAVINVKKLGLGVNRAGYSSTHPTVGYTAQGQEVLYFSSTQPGGQGGYDIWFSVKMTNGEYTASYNLGSRINTNDDEVTPFYYQRSGELFYSSNKPEGLGGFDVYKMSGQKQLWLENEAQHLPQPINSAGNDLFFVKESDSDGYLTTNRYQKDQILRHAQPIQANHDNPTFSKNSK